MRIGTKGPPAEGARTSAKYVIVHARGTGDAQTDQYGRGRGDGNHYAWGGAQSALSDFTVPVRGCQTTSTIYSDQQFGVVGIRVLVWIDSDQVLESGK